MEGKKRILRILSLSLVLTLIFSGMTALGYDTGEIAPEASYEADVAVEAASDVVSDQELAEETEEETEEVSEEYLLEGETDEEDIPEDADTCEEAYEDSDEATSEEALAEEDEDEEVAVVATSTPIVSEIGSIRFPESEWVPTIPRGTPISLIDGWFWINIYNTAGEQIGMTRVLSHMISGLNTAVLGEQTVTITFQGHTTTFIAEVVLPRDVSECACADEANWEWRLSYGGSWLPVGITLAEADMFVMIWCDECRVVVSGAPVTSTMITGFDSSTPGVRTVSVTYRGRTFSEDIRFYAIDEASIELPHGLIYFLKQGNTIESLGIFASLRVPGTEEWDWYDFIVTDAMITGFNPNQLGQQVVTLTYRGVTTTFIIEVVRSPIQAPPPPGSGNGTPPSQNGGGASPQTGDSGFAWMTYALLMAGALVFIVGEKAKKKRNVA